MIITSVQKYKGDTFEICVDEKKIYLHRDIVVDYHIKAMTEISEKNNINPNDDEGDFDWNDISAIF